MELNINSPAYFTKHSYNDFVSKYKNGMTLMEIVAEGKISRRTAYRYKAYYEELKKMQEENVLYE